MNNKKFELINFIHVLNHFIALLAGISLLTGIAIIAVDILLRELGISFGGADEISGYIMAGSVSWGMAYALTELAHVRIDLIRQRASIRWKSLFDLISIVAVAVTVCLVAYYGWPVLQKTIAGNAKSNTNLEVPLWIPQSLWLFGWAWFAVSAVTLVGYVFTLFFSKRYAQIDAVVGSRSELELEDV